MNVLRISIDKWISSDFPGWVECSLVDAFGEMHIFKEKWPVVSNIEISEWSVFPLEGGIRCTLGAMSPGGPNSMFVVETCSIDGVESIEGLSKFTVGYAKIVFSNAKS